MLKVLLRIFASLPLPLIHAAGKVIGTIMYFTSKKFAKNIYSNLLTAGVAINAGHRRNLAYTTAGEIGKGLAETFAIWFKPQDSVLKWVKACHGWEHVEAAWAQNHGIIFLTPHLGCYEITSLYYAARRPITVLYRPPRKSWLLPLIEEGRSRSQVTLAPTNMSGVRKLLRALNKKEAIGILPDQVPDPNEGVWASFFGAPAYTMTLVSKLAESSQATILLAFGERLSWGRGYIIHIEPLAGEPTPQHINDGIEKLVRLRPAQYLWSYGRFKQP